MPQERTFESRFCSFRAPAHWVPLGTVGLVDDRAAAPRSSAAVNESWNSPPRSLADLAAEHRRYLLAEHPDAELVAEGPASSQRFPEAHRCVYRLATEKGKLLLTNLQVAHGPLVCTLGTTRPEGSQDAESTEAAVVGSFEVTASTWAAAILQNPLRLSDAEHAPSSRAPLPRLQVSIPVPAGWALTEHPARLTRGDAQITLVLHGRTRGAPDRMFADNLDRLQHSEGWRATAWDRGVLAGNRSFWMLDAVHATQPSWGPPARTVEKRVFVEQNGVLEVRLVAPEADSDDARTLLAILAGLQPLAPQDRRLAIELPWIAATLEGPWVEESPGLYMRSGGPRLVVKLTELPRHEGVGPTARHGVETLARATRGALVSRNKVVEGVWKERGAVHFALDWQPPGDRPEVLRCAWVDGGKQILWLLVRGEDGAETDALFGRLLGCTSPGGCSVGDTR